MRSTLLGLTGLLASALLAVPADAQTNSTWERFTASNGGWSINGQNQISPTGGNPGGCLPWNDPIDTFGLEIRTSTNAAFTGDFTKKGGVRVSIDVQVDYIEFFGTPAPRELVLILIDDDAYGTSAPASVWTSLGVLDGNGSPYQTFITTIPDPLSVDLPTGWEGAGAEDPVTFEPILPGGRTWANVLKNVDRAMFTTYVPGFFFGFTNFDISVDNIRMQPFGTDTWVDLGAELAGTNGAPFASAAGDLSGGSQNALRVSNAPAGVFGGLAWSPTSSPVPFAGGTLVPFPFQAPIYFVTNADGRAFLPFVMPNGVAPGSTIFAQFAIFDPGAPENIVLSNAIVGTTP